MIFIIQGFQIIVFIFIVIFTMFWPICPEAFFRCFLSNSGAYIDLQAPFLICCEYNNKDEDNSPKTLNDNFFLN